MKNYGVNELRKMFLEFFESKGHLKLNSFSLVPQNDNSLLLINSGMAPLKPYFTGMEIPPKKRVTTCQKCIRTGDIENVGKTSRHGTFFEMLGNFSFGDYFKKEAIHWSWEFLTEVVGLSKDRLYPSVYLEDDEAFKIWNEEIGIPKNRIFKFGKEDNFWEHGAGPCGPCSEIYYDRGEKYGCHSPKCTVGCDCDRYMEVWNNVFTQFDNDGCGNYTELVQKNIDTGMGLERLAVVVQDVDSIFDVDTIKYLRDAICKMANIKYKENEKNDISIRLITDHIRSSTFMISDGIMPSNEGRGYVLRRLIRRAARHGHLLKIKKGFLSELSKEVIESAKSGYPELEEKRSFILQVLSMEEDKFDKTLEQGLMILEEMMKNLKGKILSGDDAFKLYDTYGFPLDLTCDILSEKNLGVDKESFEENMQKQRQNARNARNVTNYMGSDATIYDLIDPLLKTEFVGYENVSNKAKILCIAGGDELLNTISTSDRVAIFTDKTSFYATMGGQEGDRGIITTDDAIFEVDECIKVSSDKVAHIGILKSGTMKIGDMATFKPDMKLRYATCKNHSATHLLHKALKNVLGSHVEQKGSLVTNKRLRFDFSHFSSVTDDELKKVEDMVNKEIEDALDVVTDIMNLSDARKLGATALFGEKYSDNVRVVKMGDFSMELCGGTHVKNTADIGRFKIISENGIASGIRRIEAVTGNEVAVYYDKIENLLDNICHTLKCKNDNLSDKINQLLAENKRLLSENESLKNKNAKALIGNIDEKIEKIKDYNLLIYKANGLSMNDLRNLADDFKQKFKKSIIVLAGFDEGKVSLFATLGSDATDEKIHCGNLIKLIAPKIGGGGGGRKESAQAGGKNIAGIDEALNLAKGKINEWLS